MQRSAADKSHADGKSQRNHRNRSTAWKDYREAFDNVLHDWILGVLDMFKLSSNYFKLFTTQYGIVENQP